MVEKIVEKPIEKIIEKPIETIIEKPIVKIVEKIVEKPIEQIIEKPIIKRKFSEKELKITIVNSSFISIKPIPNNTLINKDEIINDGNQNINSKKEEQMEVKTLNINMLLNTNSNEINNNNINNNNTNNDTKINSKQLHNNLDNSLIFMNSFEVYSNDNIQDIMLGNTSSNIFDNIRTIKEIKREEKSTISQTKNKIEKEDDIEKYRKTCLNKIKKLQNKINIYSSPISQIAKEMKIFEQNERNLLEVLSPKNDGDSIYVFNPYLNEIEEILIPSNYKFPKNFAYLNILSYCFISGGIREQNILNMFIAIRRKARKSFEFVNLPSMLHNKYNHCMIELKFLGKIGVFGGWSSKKCEYFNMKKKEWIKLPDLNHIRESPSCCVINEKNIFCFLGYDNELSQYNNTIEKLNLNLKELKWEEIKPLGMKNYMGRKAASCLIYNYKGNDYIFIVGGINNLDKESRDILLYDEKQNKIERKKNRLPFKCSFSQNSFNLLCSGYYCNFNINSSLIQYEKLGEIFFGLSKK